MASRNAKQQTITSDKKSSSSLKNTLKSESPSCSTKTVRATIQRGKVPSNWNLYMSRQNNLELSSGPPRIRHPRVNNEGAEKGIFIPSMIVTHSSNTASITATHYPTHQSAHYPVHQPAHHPAHLPVHHPAHHPAHYPIHHPTNHSIHHPTNYPIQTNHLTVHPTGAHKKTSAATLVHGITNIGRCLAIDCEMVGIGDGRENMLARVSLVDENNLVVYDTFVRPQQKVVDYRTPISGVRPADLEKGLDFQQVQSDVYTIIKGKLLIGHAIRNDLKVLLLSHPKKYTRDTSKFKKFRDEAAGRTPSLRFLASQLLGIEIQHGEHSSIEDARAAMHLYLKYRNHWEGELRTRYYRK